MILRSWELLLSYLSYDSKLQRQNIACKYRFVIGSAESITGRLIIDSRVEFKKLTFCEWMAFVKPGWIHCWQGRDNSDKCNDRWVNSYLIHTCVWFYILFRNGAKFFFVRLFNSYICHKNEARINRDIINFLFRSFIEKNRRQ